MGVSDLNDSSGYLMRVYPALTAALIRGDRLRFRLIEAMDLSISSAAMRIYDRNRQNSDAVGLFKDKRMKSLDLRKISDVDLPGRWMNHDRDLRNAILQPLLKLDPSVCFEGGVINDDDFVRPFGLDGCKLSHSRAVQCSSGGELLTLYNRDHRSQMRVHLPLPMIKEVDRTSSEEEEEEEKGGKVKENEKEENRERRTLLTKSGKTSKPAYSRSKYENVNVRMSENVKTSDDQTQSGFVPQRLTGGSLLDAMHKRYCPDQYRKSDNQTATPQDTSQDRGTLKSTDKKTSSSPIDVPFLVSSQRTRLAIRPTLDLNRGIPHYKPPWSSSPTYSMSSHPLGRLSLSVSSASAETSCFGGGSIHLERTKEDEAGREENYVESSAMTITRNSPSSEMEKNCRETSLYHLETNAVFCHVCGENESDDDLQMDQNISESKGHSEVEAVEACLWLKEAGFPQYAQMYKDKRFPIDMEAAERDHDFLDQDALNAAFRRLEILNKCSKLKATSTRKSVDESDDEEEYALSNKWKFQRVSRQWSRAEADLLPHLIDGGGGRTDTAASFNSSLRSNSSRDSALAELDDAAQKHTTLDACLSVNPMTFSSLPGGGGGGGGTPCDHSLPSPLRDCKGGPSSAGDSSQNQWMNKLKRPNLLLPQLSLDLSSSGKENDILLEYDDNVFSFGTDVKESSSFSFPSPSPSPSGNDASKGLPPAFGRHHHSDPENAPSLSPGLRRAASDKFRGALNILKKMEGSLKMKRAPRKPGGGRGELSKLDIGSPVLVESPEVRAKMDSLGCMDIKPVSEEVTVESKAEKPSSFGSEFPNDSVTLSPNAIPNSQGTHRQQLPSDTKQSTPMLRLKKSACSGIDGCENSTGKNLGDVPENGVIADHSCEENGFAEELFNGATFRQTSAVSSRPRISVYDNVLSSPPPEKSCAFESELDMILSELYKNINSLDYSMSKISRCTGNSPSSSVCTIDEEDVNCCNPRLPDLRDVNQMPKQPIRSCLSVDSNISSTPKERSSSLDCLTMTTTTRVKLSPSTQSRDPFMTQVHDPLMLEVFDLYIDEPPPLRTSVVENGTKDAEGVNLNSVIIERPPLAANVPSDAESTGSVEQKDESWLYPVGEGRERRDSGVGSSLTRTTSSKRQKRLRIRWHSFAKSHQVALSSSCDHRPISSLSAGQLAVLRKLSLLKVTAALEKYAPANRAHWSWFVPRLKKRCKTPDYSEKNVFGVPVAVTQQRHGQPLPQCILFAMRRLRRTASDSVGIFRKSGVRSRVQSLRIAVETDPDSVDFDGLNSYDVADLLKLYFRELPECLLTNKLSHIFISIFQYVPTELRSDLLRVTILLLPDEHRLTLQSLLLFLSDLAEHSDSNQMNASNLAVCFAPSLFHLCGTKSNRAAAASSSSSKQTQKRPAVVATEKDLVDQKVAHECLTYLITDAKNIFTVSEEMLSKCQLSYLEQGDPLPLEELCRKYGKGDYTAYIDSCVQGVLKESRDKFKGWISVPISTGDVDLAYKKVGDGHPLRLWKFCVEVEAPPIEVLNRILRERHVWDDDILKWRVIEKLDEQTEVFQYVLSSMAPHPNRDFSELRYWRVDLPRGVCLLISTSVEHVDAPLMGDVRGVVLASRYLIEPCGSGRSRLTHINRIDLRGHSPDWYNNIFGFICIAYARRIRDSFKTSIVLTNGPETKV